MPRVFLALIVIFLTIIVVAIMFITISLTPEQGEGHIVHPATKPAGQQH